MPMQLSVESGPERGASVSLGAGVIIGRDDGCNLRLTDQRASGRHAYAAPWPDGSVHLRDLGSPNGTFVDGVPVVGDVVLRGGERLQIGDTVIAVVADPAVAALAPPDLPAPLERSEDERTLAGAPIIGLAGAATAPGEPRSRRWIAPPSWQGHITPPILPPPPPSKRSGWKRFRFPLFGAAALILVVALVVTAAILSGKGTPSANGSSPTFASPSPSALPLLAPQDIRSTVHGVQVSLSWSQPEGSAPAQTYDVYRNGGLVKEDLTATAVTDDAAPPGRTYSYEVRARAEDGSTKSAFVSVAVPALSLSDARVGGEYKVQFKTVSEYGYVSSIGNPFGTGSYGTQYWSLRPRCKTGPCSVTWKDSSWGTYLLARDGATYKGDSTGFRFVTCGGTHANSSITIEFHPAKARAIDGEWRATKIAGTWVRTTAAQLGCRSTGDTEQITGTRYS